MEYKGKSNGMIGISHYAGNMGVKKDKIIHLIIIDHMINLNIHHARMADCGRRLIIFSFLSSISLMLRNIPYI